MNYLDVEAGQARRKMKSVILMILQRKRILRKLRVASTHKRLSHVKAIARAIKEGKI